MQESIAFEIIEELKEGGQKKVCIINHPSYNKCVLKHGKCAYKSSLDRIKREVDILENIESEYFPKNYESTFTDDGEFILIEEHIESLTLNEVRDDYLGDEKKVLDLAQNLIKGLKILWSKKIVHRDLKPDNILIKENGQPVIIDLGIARILDDKSLTLTIQPNGPCTPIYASPEQFKNNKNSIDMRADFYSLAIIISELILGKHPFSPEVVGDGMTTLENLINNRYKLVYEDNKLSAGLEKIIKKLLKAEPYQRIRTCEKLEEEIAKILPI